MNRPDPDRLECSPEGLRRMSSGSSREREVSMEDTQPIEVPDTTLAEQTKEFADAVDDLVRRNRAEGIDDQWGLDETEL